MLRVGQHNNVVDNAGSGCIFSGIDSQIGIVRTDGADYFGNVYTEHPQTGVTFKGF